MKEPALAFPSTAGGSPAARGQRRWLRLLALVAVLILALGALAWLGRTRLLTGAALAFIHDEPLPERADAIVVLGGALHLRPAGAARLYLQGRAPRILVTRPEETSANRLGLMETEDVVATRILESLGVPGSAIERLSVPVTSTYDEAVATRRWLDAHGGATVLVPTNHFHTRRVNWVFEKVLGPGRDARVSAIKPDRYEPWNWWHSEYGVNEFQSELLKLAYYWVTY